MARTIFLVFQIFLLMVFAPAVAVAQNGQSSRLNAQSEPLTPAADHHQHLFSPAYAKLQSPDFKIVTAHDLIGFLDQSGIRRALVLSTAYRWGRPGAEPPDEYAGVKAENDWTAAQVALYPKRLIGFCGFNPLKDYALDELARCAKDPNLRRGIKMHFGNSDVQLENTEHFEKLKKIFQAANNHRMAVVVHLRASISKKRPYGAEQARRFLELLSFAPEVPVQIAHFAGSGPGYVDPPAHEVIKALADAVAQKDRRTHNLWFDISTNVHPENPAEISNLLIELIRRIGVKRILFGSDGAAGGNPLPRESWAALRGLKLTKKEIKTIARNVAPYFH